MQVSPLLMNHHTILIFVCSGEYLDNLTNIDITSNANLPLDGNHSSVTMDSLAWTPSQGFPSEPAHSPMSGSEFSRESSPDSISGSSSLYTAYDERGYNHQFNHVSKFYYYSVIIAHKLTLGHNMQVPCGDEVPNSGPSYPLLTSSRVTNAPHNSGRTMNLVASIGKRVISVFIECRAHDGFRVSDEELYRALLMALAVRSRSASPM